MVFGKTFSGALAQLSRFTPDNWRLCSPRSCCACQEGGAAFVAAKGVGAQMAERLLTLGWRGGLELLPALLLLRCAVLLVAPGGFSTLLLLRRGGFQLRFLPPLATLLLGRRAVVTAVITALGGLLQLR